MPAMPIAESSAPIVVGISATSSATSVVIEIVVSANSANGFSETITNRNTSVSPASRMFSAISFGVLRRSAPSTSAIMRSRNDLPGLLRDLDHDPVTEHPRAPRDRQRSPPDSRITGADSPVIADSSTDAIPSITVPSPGITSPASTTTRSPRASSDAARVPPSASRAVVSERIVRSAAAWARPRPSASASARLAKTTVSHNQTVTVSVNQAGSSVPTISAIVVIVAPISTTNMTGLRTCTRGSSFLKDAAIAGPRMSGVNRDPDRRSRGDIGAGGACVAVIGRPGPG